MKHPKPTCIDFETFAIEGRPDYPPMPVGVSIKHYGKPSKYYAFGHSEGNNASWNEAKAAVAEAYKSKDGVLFQNAKFDVDVAETWFGLPCPSWDRIHDTMFLLFLDDPHQLEMGLKPSAERLLDWAPEEQDAVKDWLVQNQPVPGIKIGTSEKSKNPFGAYIAYAPGTLVGDYANGDVDRTEGIFNLLWQKTMERQMAEAYDRERKLMVVLLEMEQQGVPVNLPLLQDNVTHYGEWQTKIDAWIVERLKADADINLDSGQQLMMAMIESGAADPDKVPKTPTGKYQTNKEALLDGVVDDELLAVLKYRTQLNTCLNTFMRPWRAVAEQSGGLIYTTWNQVRSPAGGGQVGTRTGRLSSRPNFQNIPNTFGAIFFLDNPKDPEDGISAKPKALKDLPPLPSVREYITSFKDEVLVGRDFSSQELRILAHFEDGEMRLAYQENSTLDLHQYAADLVTQVTGITVTRKQAKNIAFSILYGSGNGKLAEGLGCTVNDAKALRKAYLGTFPGIKVIMDDLKSRAKQKLPIRTIGGREYHCEEPKMIQGRMWHFDYKMLNYLIQGSAADQTKDAVIEFYFHPDRKATLLASVHDEILISVPKRLVKSQSKLLDKCMQVSTMDIPIVTDAEQGSNWREMMS